MSGSRSPRRGQAALSIIEAGRRRRSHNLNLHHYTPYSHIQVRAFPVRSDERSQLLDAEEAFVRRASIQDQLKYVPLSSSIAHTQTRIAAQWPTSFAEAVIMTRCEPGQGGSRGASSDTALDQSSSLPSFRTTLKSSRKKIKKWTPLDFGAAESSFEGAGESTSAFQAAPAAPDTPAGLINAGAAVGSSLLLTTAQDYSLPFPHTSPQAATYSSPHSATSHGHIWQPSVDPDQTPTQAAFNESFARLSVVAPIASNDRSIIYEKDSESTKGKLEEIMSRIDDAFDVEDWDPALATVDLDNSPEHLTVNPQPVTYTTVGSLVKSNAAPQFTAPVRIQREGACRRPPPTPIQVRGHDNFMGLRGTTPQHNMGYNAPIQSPYRPQPPAHLQSARVSTGMSDTDRAILNKLGVTTPTMRSGNVPPITQKTVPNIDPFVSSSSTEVSKVLGLMKEESIDQASLGNTAISALDKMQTLLGLSQYQNPMQQFAKDRLAEFAATKIQAPAPTPAVPVLQQSTVPNSSQFPFSSHNQMAQSHQETDVQRKGQLDVDYRFPPFPPPGLAPSSMGDQMMRGSGLVPHNQSGLCNTQMPTPQQYHAHSGRPQPLKAGPPGQRQNTTGNSFPRFNPLPSGQASGLSRAQPTAALQPNSPWLAHNRQNMFTSVPIKASQIRDTLSPEDAAKYYPNGLPPGITGSFVPHSDKSNEEKRIESLTQWWYSGVRRSNKTRTDWVGELEQRELELKSGSMAQPFPSPPLPSPGNHLSVKQIKEMSEAECAAPLLDTVFGTLLGYADRVITPTNKSLLSKFEQPSPHLIDSGAGGNDSLFGEDWGAPHGPQGRVPRYPKHYISKRN